MFRDTHPETRATRNTSGLFLLLLSSKTLNVSGRFGRSLDVFVSSLKSQYSQAKYLMPLHCNFEKVGKYTSY